MSLRQSHTCSGYVLLDSGNFEKLEQIGPYRLIRPSPQAMWKPARADSLWTSAHARYHRSSAGGGRWEYRSELPGKWSISCYRLTMEIRLTDFGHIGLFPEQAPNWQWIQEQVGRKKAPVKVLNVFAYSGGSTLAAAAAGAEVVHVDAARGMESWARENAKLSALDGHPIRWLVDDVTRFIRREIRRRSRYDGIILDPPSFGRGSRGEVWKIEDDLPSLLDQCCQILRPSPLFFLLSAHTPGITPLSLENLLADVMGRFRGSLSSAEMVIPEEKGARVLPSGAMARWQALKT